MARKTMEDATIDKIMGMIELAADDIFHMSPEERQATLATIKRQNFDEVHYKIWELVFTNPKAFTSTSRQARHAPIKQPSVNALSRQNR